MKNFLFVAAALFIILSSSFQCRKNDAVADQTNKERSLISGSLAGKWELREARGDMPVMKFASGNGNIIKLDGQNYNMYENSNLTKSGTYSIETDGTVEQNICMTGVKDIFKHRIIFDNERKFNQFVTQPDSLKPPVITTLDYGKIFIGFSKNADTLMLASGCFASDGGSITKYVKIQ